MDSIIANRFEIIDELGQGGMGKVWLATDLETGKVVAFKLMLELSTDKQVKFDQMVSIIRNLRHKSIAQFVASGTHKDMRYIVTEFVAGNPISKEDDLAKNLAYISQIVDALDYIHGKDIVHRDVKLTNILVSADKATLLDFGLAIDLNLDRLSSSGGVAGTIAYMAPEQLYGQAVDHRSDLYSVGVVLYELATGKIPFKGESFPELVSMITTIKPDNPCTSNPTLNKDLCKIIMKLLEKDPSRRYQSAKELNTDLRSLISGMPLVQPKQIMVASNKHPFFGRQEELLKFGVCLGDLRQGKGFVCCVNGPLGIGKTRFVQQLQSLALTRSVKFIIVDKDNTAYGMSALSTLFDQLAAYDLECDTDLAKKLAFDLRQHSPSFANTLGLEISSNKTSNPDIHKSLADLAVSCFAKHPVIFVFEDNIDDLTNAVAYELSKLAQENNIGVIFVSTVSEASNLNFPTACKNIKLAPLTDANIKDIAASIIGKDRLTQKVADEISAKSGGFPLICTSLAQNFAEGKEDIFKDMLDQKTSQIHETAYSGMTEESKTLACVMSFLTSPVTIEQLQAIVGYDDEKMLKCIMELQNSGFTSERFTGIRTQLEIASPVVRWFVTKSLPKEKIIEYNGLIAISSGKKEMQKDPIYKCEAAMHFIDCDLHAYAFKTIVPCAKELIEDGRPFVAEKYLEKLLPYLDKVKDDMLLCNYLVAFFKSLLRSMTVVDMAPLIMHAYEILKNESMPPDNKIDMALHVSSYSKFQRRYDLLNEFTNYAQKYVTKDTSADKLAELHNDLAICNLGGCQAPDHKKAIKNARKAVELAQKTNDRKLLGNSLETLGISLADAGEHKEAEECFMNAYETYSDIGDHNSMASNLFNFTICLSEQKKFGEAIKAATQLMGLSAQSDNVKFQIEGRMMLASCHISLFQIREASNVCDEMLEMTNLYPQNKLTPLMFRIPCILKLNRLELGKLEECVSKMNSLAEKIGDTEHIFLAKRTYAEILYIKGEHEKAVEMSKNLINDIEKEKEFRKENLLKGLAKYHAASGDHKTAMEMIDQLKSMHQGHEVESKNNIERELFVAEAIAYDHILSSREYNYDLKSKIKARVKHNLSLFKNIESTNFDPKEYAFNFQLFYSLPETAYAQGLFLRNAKNLDIYFNVSQVEETLVYIESALDYMIKNGLKRLWQELTNLRVELMKSHNM